MIDAKYQGKGYGSRALELIIQHVETRPNAREFYTSHLKDNDATGCFYRKFGFKYTGEVLGGDLEIKLAFWPGVFHMLLDLTTIRPF